MLRSNQNPDGQDAVTSITEIGDATDSIAPLSNDELRNAVLHRNFRTSPEPDLIGTDYSGNRVQNVEFEPSYVDFGVARSPDLQMSRFSALQEWEGYVEAIDVDEFVAILADLTADQPYEIEEAVIPLSEISYQDRLKIKVGSIFRWVIGYETSVSGTRRRVSEIVFRNLPSVTDTDIQSGRDWMRSVKLAINVE